MKELFTYDLIYTFFDALETYSITHVCIPKDKEILKQFKKLYMKKKRESIISALNTENEDLEEYEYDEEFQYGLKFNDIIKVYSTDDEYIIRLCAPTQQYRDGEFVLCHYDDNIESVLNELNLTDAYGYVGYIWFDRKGSDLVQYPIGKKRNYYPGIGKIIKSEFNIETLKEQIEDGVFEDKDNFNNFCYFFKTYKDNFKKKDQKEIEKIIKIYGTHLTVFWKRPLCKYGEFLGNGELKKQDDTKFGWKRIKYTNKDGQITYANPYEAGTIEVRPYTNIYFEMYGGGGRYSCGYTDCITGVFFEALFNNSSYGNKNLEEPLHCCNMLFNINFELKTDMEIACIDEWYNCLVPAIKWELHFFEK